MAARLPAGARGERLLPDPGARARDWWSAAWCFGRGRALDDVRIRHFEDGEYAEHWSVVRLPGGRRLAARVFLALEALQATDEAWDLGAWASAHKAEFLAQCREWMRDCPPCEGEPAALKRTTS